MSQSEPEAQSSIDVFGDEIAGAVIHDEFKLEPRMGVEKFSEAGDEVNPRESNGRADAKAPFEAGAGATCGSIGLIGFSDSAEGALVEGDSSFSGSEPASGAREEAHPEPFLKAGDGLGNCRLADFHIARGR